MASRSYFDGDDGGWEFGIPLSDDGDARLTLDGLEESGDRLHAALARVLLREGLACGNLQLCVVGWLDENEHQWTRLAVATRGSQALEVQFELPAVRLFDYDNWAGGSVGTSPFTHSWGEFVVTKSEIDLVQTRILTSEFFMECFGYRCDFTLGEGALSAEAAFDPAALSDAEREVVDLAIGEFDPDDSINSLYDRLSLAEEDEWEPLVCAFFRDVSRRYPLLDAQGLLDLNAEWDQVPAYIEEPPIRLQLAHVPWSDGMIWNGLPEDRQLAALEGAPDWLCGVAAFVPGTTEGTLRWMAMAGPQFGRECIRDNTSLPDEIRALAVLSS